MRTQQQIMQMLVDLKTFAFDSTRTPDQILEILREMHQIQGDDFGWLNIQGEMEAIKTVFQNPVDEGLT